MSAHPFHLGWFTNFMPPAWQGVWGGTEQFSWADGQFYVDMARSLERAGFDFIMLEDSEIVPDSFGGTMEHSLKYSFQAPKLDPLLLATIIARETERLGIITTLSTSFFPPFLLARAMASLDHISHGRAGWNIVTSSEDRAAQNFGMDKLFEHDSRYDRASDFTELVMKLWDSWEPDAVIGDREAGVYADGSKVAPIFHEGPYYSSRGPLNLHRSPQGHPVICQAGSSPRGREFAAKYAEVILAVPTGIEKMKEFRDDIRRRMVEFGRDPDDCKIMYICEPTLGTDEAEAEARWKARWAPTPENIERGLIGMSFVTEIDFSKLPLDQPLPTDLHTNGHQSSLKNFYSYGETLQDVALAWQNHYALEQFKGTPDQVAENMETMLEQVGGDGFLITGALTRRFIAEVTDGLVPALQRRGLTRPAYTHEMLRDNLRDF